MFVVLVEVPEHEEDMLLSRVAELGTTGSDREGETLRIWFRGEAEARACAGQLAELRARIESVEDRDWNAAWQSGWRALTVGRRWYLHPPWQTDETAAAEGRVRLLLRPGMSFGNGDHPTSQLCLELMEEVPIEGRVFLDCGCGSGLLQTAAKEIGARVAIGCDLDEDAVVEARRYGCAGFAGSLNALACASVDALCANIQLGVLLELLPAMRAVLRPGGHAILSGVLVEQAEELRERACSVAESTAAAPWHFLRMLQRDGWAALLFAADAQVSELRGFEERA